MAIIVFAFLEAIGAIVTGPATVVTETDVFTSSNITTGLSSELVDAILTASAWIFVFIEAVW